MKTLKEMTLQELQQRSSEVADMIKYDEARITNMKKRIIAIHFEMERRKIVDPHEVMLDELGYHDRVIKYRTEPGSRSAIVQGVIRAEIEAHKGNQAIYVKLVRWNQCLLKDDIITRAVFDENHKFIQGHS